MIRIELGSRAKNKRTKATSCQAFRQGVDEEDNDEGKDQQQHPQKDRQSLFKDMEAELNSSLVLRDGGSLAFEQERVRDALDSWKRAVDLLGKIKSRITSLEDQDIIRSAIEEEQTVSNTLITDPHIRSHSEDHALRPEVDLMRDLRERADRLLSETFDMMSQAELSQGNDWNAIQLAEKALHLRPRWVDALITLSRAQRNFGEIVNSVSRLREALDLVIAADPDDPQRHSIEEELREALDLESRFIAASSQQFGEESQDLDDFRRDRDLEINSLSQPKLPVVVLRARTLDLIVEAKETDDKMKE